MRTPLRLVAALGGLSLFGPLTTDVYLPGLPSLARDLHASTATAQVTFTATVVGLGIGQVVVGPIADALGRRRPLLIGMVLFTASSLACALAGSIALLTLLRLVQGLAGAAGIVLSRAMVRDSFDGLDAARMFSTLAAVLSIGPIVAPALGGVLLLVADWRGVFWFLTLAGVVLVATSAAWTTETLPPARRRSGGMRDVARTYRALAHDRDFLRYAIAGAASAILLFGFIASSTYVYQDSYGFSPQVFGALFAVNGLAMMAVSVVNRRLIGRVHPRRLLGVGMAWIAIAGCAVAAATVLGAGRWLVVPLVSVAFSGLALVFSNAMALALADQGERAGAASGLIGLLQFTTGAVVAPVIGAVGATPAAMGVTMAAGGLLPVVLYWVIGAPRGTPATA